MKTILLLHGAIGAEDQLQALAAQLSNDHEVRLFTFSGHGTQPGNGDGFSIKKFAAETVAYMDEQQLRDIPVFGYSMGGYVALYVAQHYPGRIGKITTLATKFNWDEATAAKEVQMLDAEKIAQKLPAFATALEQRHTAAGWQNVLTQTASMMLKMGADNPLPVAAYADINIPVLLLLGDRDKMVTLDETVTVYKALPNAQMAVLPGTAHPIEQANTSMLAFFIRQNN